MTCASCLLKYLCYSLVAKANHLTVTWSSAHIADLNERRRLALAEIDKAPFGWYHVRAVMVAGIGFFTDSVCSCLFGHSPAVFIFIYTRPQLLSRFLPQPFTNKISCWLVRPLRCRPCH